VVAEDAGGEQLSDPGAERPLLSFCVVNTNGREHLLRGLAAIETTRPPGTEAEVLVLDNASEDGSVEAVEGLGRDIALVALDRRTGKAENDSTLLKRARGEYCLLLNEDAELCPGAPLALLDALEADPVAGAAAAQLLDPTGRPQPCAWRLPGLATALTGAAFLQRRLVVQSGGVETRRVGWAQSSALLVRRAAAAEVGYLDPDFFVYSDETDFAKRLGDAGWTTLLVPAARAVHHEQLSTDLGAARRRIVEFHRGRDRYMRKHHGALSAAAVRALSAWFYAVRAAAALVLPGHDPRRYALHARQSLRPWRGEGLREAAAAHNERLETAACAH
jgi:N-acetylglucosaminyl-diphospho-decaprenol L-rhamnosyltransferase